MSKFSEIKKEAICSIKIRWVTYIMMKHKYELMIESRWFSFLWNEPKVVYVVKDKVWWLK